jgi:hypothetical protein
MKIIFFIFILHTSLHLFAQKIPYRPKFLIEYDFPRRFQIGVKVLSSSPLSFSLKGGYQLLSFNVGSYGDYGSSITKPWSLSGPIANAGMEYALTKNLNHFISFEFEAATLTGHYSYPYKRNVGKDYNVTRSKVQALSNTFLLGYYYHVRHNYNFSVFAKVGGIDRYAVENVYYEGSRLPNSTNQLKEPINKSYHEIVFTARLGFQYCFGYSKISKSRKRNDYSLMKIYLQQKDSLVNAFYNNYQYTADGRDEFKDLKDKLNHWLRMHPFSKDSIRINNKFEKYKLLIERQLLDRTMKVDTYKRVIKLNDGRIKNKRKHIDYFNHRNSRKYKQIYLDSKLN